MLKNIIRKMMKNRFISKYLIENERFLYSIIHLFNLIFGFNKLKIRKNRFKNGTTLLIRFKVFINGHNNIVEIGNKGYFNNSRIIISGNNNQVKLSDGIVLNNVHIDLEGDNNSIIIGENTTFYGSTDLAAIEGTNIYVGEDCMFSGNIQFRTGDSHSIINEDGTRINMSKDIVIGSHVWIGTNVICLKGTTISNNCVIGAGSLVNSTFEKTNSIIAGNPAKYIKGDINWIRERI